jgi:hypothetical protein
MRIFISWSSDSNPPGANNQKSIARHFVALILTLIAPPIGRAFYCFSIGVTAPTGPNVRRCAARSLSLFGTDLVPRRRLLAA